MIKTLKVFIAAVLLLLFVFPVHPMEKEKGKKEEKPRSVLNKEFGHITVASAYTANGWHTTTSTGKRIVSEFDYPTLKEGDEVTVVYKSYKTTVRPEMCVKRNGTSVGCAPILRVETVGTLKTPA